MSSSHGLFHQIKSAYMFTQELFGMQAVHFSNSTIKRKLQNLMKEHNILLNCLTVWLFLLQESATSPQGSCESSRCSPSNEAAPCWHTLSCEICRLHGTNAPSAEREGASFAQTLPQRNRSDMQHPNKDSYTHTSTQCSHCFLGQVFRVLFEGRRVTVK